MGRLRILSERDVIEILESNGFIRVRQRGSHVVMQTTHIGVTVTVPVPDHKELRTGTLMSIIRQPKLPRALFEH